jgi:S-DNA-T family DNA segregation ATPase FtsK/SpoIIIE
MPVMSFPLGSLQGDGAAIADSVRVSQSPAPWQRQALLIATGLIWVLFTLALFTYSAADPAFTTSGTGAPVHNKVGLLGARAADMAYFLFGYSAWWLVVVALRAWLSTLARTLRHEPVAPRQLGWALWLGLALLLASSAALEWTRLYRWESLLPGHAGGVLGLLLGPLSMRWLGFAGSGVWWIALLVVGSSLALRFSWVQLADSVGERLDTWRQRHLGRREAQEDRRMGEVALREREQVVEVQRQEVEDHVPLVIHH